MMLPPELTRARKREGKLTLSALSAAERARATEVGEALLAVTTAAIAFDAAHVGPGVCVTRPLGSMNADTPMLTERTSDRRHSTARNRLTAKCCSCSWVPLNQPSLEMLTKKSTGSVVT